jgi:RHH-type transcriptional regulator, rel operon repressor / antitoxin RelB
MRRTAALRRCHLFTPKATPVPFFVDGGYAHCAHVLQEVVVTVTIRLTPDEEARLDSLSRRTGRTKSFYVRTAIQAYLEDLEDAYAADEAMKDFEAGGRRSRPIADLVAELVLTGSDVAEGRALNAADR